MQMKSSHGVRVWLLRWLHAWQQRRERKTRPASGGMK